MTAQPKMQRSNFEQEMHTRLQALGAQIGRLVAMADTAEEGARDKYRQAIQDLQSRRDAVSKKVDELRGASDAAWEDLKSGIDRSWQELKQSAEKAFAEFK